MSTGDLSSLLGISVAIIALIDGRRCNGLVDEGIDQTERKMAAMAAVGDRGI